MGLLGAIGAGLGAGLESVANNMKQESALQRNLAMLKQKMEMESEQRMLDKQRDAEFQDSRDAAKRARIEGRAGELAQARSAGDIAKLDSVGAEYDSLLKSGKMTQEQYDAAQQGLQGGRGLLSRATNADFAQAAARETGSYGDLYKMERDSKKDAIDAEDRAYGREKDTRDFELRKKTEARLAAQAGQSAKMATLQLEEATLKLDQLKKEAKIPPAVRATADSLSKQVEDARKQLNAAILKGEADPAGIEKIVKDINALSTEAANLRRPYMGDESRSAEFETRYPPKNKPSKSAQDTSDVSSSNKPSVSNVTADDYRKNQEAREARRLQIEEEKRIAALERKRNNGTMTDAELREWNRIMGSKQ